MCVAFTLAHLLETVSQSRIHERQSYQTHKSRAIKLRNQCVLFIVGADTSMVSTRGAWGPNRHHQQQVIYITGPETNNSSAHSARVVVW